MPDPTNPQQFNRYTYSLNNPVRYTDPTGHRPSDGCEYEGCELDDYLDPNETWITAQGQVSLIDPVLAAQYPGELTWEEVAFSVGGMVGISALPAAIEYGIAQVAIPTLAKAGGMIASWLCLGDGNCGNEIQTVLQGANKVDARTALRAGIEQLTTGQTAKALEALSKGRVDSFTIKVIGNGNSQFVAERAGIDGFQRLTYLVDPSGRTLSILQQAYNSAGVLVHEHEWLSNVIIK